MTHRCGFANEYINEISAKAKVIFKSIKKPKRMYIIPIIYYTQNKQIKFQQAK